MKGYMHPTPLHVEELLKVPWLEVPYEERKIIEKEMPVMTDDIDMDDVESHLEDLGYV